MSIKTISILFMAAVLLTGCGSGGSGGSASSQGTSSQNIQYQPNPMAVTFSAESAQASSTTVDPSGGTVSATGTDGTVYKLNIPQNALISSQSITLTPLSSVSGLPLSGPDTIGVKIEPDGLQLFKNATLTITPAGGLQLANGLTEVGFGFHGSGSEFYLKAASGNSSTVTMSLAHFSGYGVSGGTEQEIKNQQDNHAPTAVSDWVDQENAIYPGDTDEAQILKVAYALDFPKVQMGVSNPDIYGGQALLAFADWERQYTLSPFAQTVPELMVDNVTIETSFTNMVLTYIPYASSKCSEHHLEVIRTLLRWNYIELIYPELASKLPGNLETDAENCAHFELDFDSDFKQQSGNDNIEMELTATVPIKPLSNGNGLLLMGSADEHYKTATYPQISGCNVTVTTSPDVFDVPRINLGLNLTQAGTAPINLATPPTYLDLAVSVQPNYPDELVTITCSNGQSEVLNGPYWLAAWSVMHQDDLGNGGYVLSYWQPGTSGSDVVGTTTYDQVGASALTEHTVVTLKHTPLPF